MWNLLCQYNNIYADSYKYLKGKKKKKEQMEDWRKNKKKKNYSYCSYSATWTNQSGTIATVQNLGGKKGSLHQKGHCRGIASSYIVSRKKSTNRWLGKKKKIHIEQTKSTVTFTHSRIHLTSVTTFS